MANVHVTLELPVPDGEDPAEYAERVLGYSSSTIGTYSRRVLDAEPVMDQSDEVKKVIQDVEQIDEVTGASQTGPDADNDVFFLTKGDPADVARQVGLELESRRKYANTAAGTLKVQEP